MSEDVSVRFAKIEDAAHLAAIYAPYVKNTPITFEYNIPDLAEFENRILKISASYPYLVAYRQNEILGYTYASPFKGRAAYDWSVETSIYVTQNARGSGIGSLLYEKLEEALKKQNICSLYAGITHPNPESIAFHQKCGYVTAAHLHKAGFKFGAWHDIIWMEKFISEHSCSPKPFIPIKEVSL